MEIDEIIWPDLTPVKHKREGYVGWIDGRTKMKEFFTGNMDCLWQYRVCVPGESNKRIAPKEDLKINLNNPPLPAMIEEHKDENSRFRKETVLHSLGYKLTDMTAHQREELLLNVAVPYLKLGKVIRTILDLIYSKKQNIPKHLNALVEWNIDIEMLLNTFGLDHSEITREVLSYIFRVKEMMEKHRVPQKISSAQIKQAMAQLPK